MEGSGNSNKFDMDKITDTLAPEESGGKDRVVFRLQRKSVLGLDMLADAKRTESKVGGSFRVPKDRVASVAASLDEGEETPVSSGIDEVENVASTSLRSNRRYRESASSNNFASGVTEEASAIQAYGGAY